MLEDRLNDSEAEGGAIDPPHNDREETGSSLSSLDSEEEAPSDPPHNT